MQLTAHTLWPAHAGEPRITLAQKACWDRLGMMIGPHLRAGPVRIHVSEEITHTDAYGLPRVVYTLQATIEPA